MQIRIEPENEEPLRISAKRNRRSIAKEGNVAMEEYLAGVRTELRNGKKLPPAKRRA